MFRKIPRFNIVIYIYTLIMLLNSIITPSAYSALHSGHVGSYSSSTTFRLNPAYLLLFTMLMVIIISRKVYINNIAYILVAIIVASTVLNVTIIHYYSYYLLDIVALLCVSNLAKEDSSVIRDKNQNFERLTNYILGLLVIGFVLLLIGHGRFGILPFEFSRSSRGEVTIWSLFYLPAILFSILFARFKKNYPNKKVVIITMFVGIVVLSTLSRVTLLLFIVLFAVYWIERKSDSNKYILSVLVLIGAILMYSQIKEILTLGENEVSLQSIERILNGRFALWKYYWEAFISHPIIGCGAAISSSDLYVKIGAASEVGLLKNIAQYGMVYLIAIMYILIVSIKNFMIAIKNVDSLGIYDVFMMNIFVVAIATLFQQHARILNMGDFIVWYAIFYFYEFRNGVIANRMEMN